jgi:hypothetical protein
MGAIGPNGIAQAANALGILLIDVGARGGQRILQGLQVTSRMASWEGF